MATKCRVGINGFGRIGRLTFRYIMEMPEFEVVLINELIGGAETGAYLAKFDSVHGTWENHEVDNEGDEWMLVDGKKIKYTGEKDFLKVDWAASQVDMVLECSGVYLKTEVLKPYLEQCGVKRVIVSAPVKEASVLNVVVGVNDDKLTADHTICTAASCTTNCIAPIIKVLAHHLTHFPFVPHCMYTRTPIAVAHMPRAPISHTSHVHIYLHFSPHLRQYHTSHLSHARFFHIPQQPHLSRISRAHISRANISRAHISRAHISCPQVLHESIGIEKGMITTVHDITGTQSLVDMVNSKKKDLRRCRSGMLNLAPTSTGSATAVAEVFPELRGKLNGHAIRVPMLNSSITDMVFVMKKDVTVEEVNGMLEAASKSGPLASTELHGPILGFEKRPLVSTDYTNDVRSTIVDAPSTMVVQGNMLKVYAWYDNEAGYSMRMAELARIVNKRFM